MKIEDFKKKLDSLSQNKEREKDYNFVVQEYYSREERHYCAFLFSWLIQDPQNVKRILESFSSLLIDSHDLFTEENVKLFYEFTWLRDIVYEFGRNKELKGKKEELKDENEQVKENKEQLKIALNDFVFENGGDIQKKKPDLAIYLKSSKKLILIEAKFEEKFDNIQIEETKKYGEALAKLLGKEIIQKTYVAMLGRSYYLDKLRGINKEDSEKEKEVKRESYKYPCLSWEKLVGKITDKDFIIKNEIEKGLENQKRIHPKT